MDGVVADFNKFASDILGREVGWHEKDLTSKEWLSLASIPNMFYQLPLIEESTRLVATAKSLSAKFNVEFLSALPRETTMLTAAEDKIKWVSKYYPGMKVNFGPFSRDKWKWGKPGDILIDDKYPNILDWFEKSKGVAIFHEGDFKRTINHLLHASNNEEATILS
jgi:5'(3')-deoxyribonucleotidase